MKFTNSGTITHMTQVKGHDLFNMIVLDNGLKTHVNFLVDKDDIKAIIEQISNPAVRKTSDLVGTEILGAWHLPVAGQEQVINERHPLVVDGAPKEMTIMRNGKEVVLKLNEKAKAGDIFVYGEETDELRQRYRHTTPPQYTVTNPQLSRILQGLKVERELAELGLGSTPNLGSNPQNALNPSLSQTVKDDLSQF